MTPKPEGTTPNNPEPVSPNNPEGLSHPEPEVLPTSEPNGPRTDEPGDLSTAEPDHVSAATPDRVPTAEPDGLSTDEPNGLSTYVLAAMRLASGTDPVPDRVSTDAVAAYALRLPGAIIATPTDVAAASGARSGSEPQRHRFTTDTLTIDIELTLTNGRLEVAGHLTPAPAPDTWIEIRTPHISKIRTPTPDGHFAATGLPPGWLSIVHHHPENPSTATRWLRARA
ncbi:hypothetical protein Acor_43940 [Acrocarpospora corrugata]|uniref:Uncharacterized protein n=1 Tax=Acrocarpospora corrugata TaxID=35763 RepID=A0A5M3W728_9ACTN|nr:hypothetical protein [Acrocarpospora corrugata]GES02328.1 hypothetical protein Acor_43940 [Acrocarpospora corrugata]